MEITFTGLVRAKSLLVFRAMDLRTKHAKHIISVLFDDNFYFQQLRDHNTPVKDLKIHFLKKGWKEPLNPHCLFDVSYYLAQVPSLANSNQNPLLHFLKKGWKEQLHPHPLFDVSYYLEQLPVLLSNGENPLLHFLRQGWKEGVNPHPLFDISYYLTHSPDVEKEGLNPLVHFLQWGAAEGRMPHILFNTAYYQDNYPELEANGLNPLIHFLTTGFKQQVSPHPLFHCSFYKNTYLADSTENPLLDYLRHPDHNPHPLFNTRAYLKQHPHLIESGENPLVHKLNQYASIDQGGNLIVETMSAAKQAPIPRKPGKTIVYIASHEASRTGAPLIILQLARYFSLQPHIELVFFMHRGGPLLKDFEVLGPVIILEENSPLYEVDEWLNHFIDESDFDPPSLAIVNSMSSNFFVKSFGEKQIPVLTLVHEFATSYPEKDVQRILHYSRKIIFPSEFTQAIALKNFQIPDDIHSVIPQGLLNRKFGQMNREIARKQICTEFNLPEEAFIILGCGCEYVRKGVDYFLQVAAQYRRQYGQDVYFVWLGEVNDTSFFSRFMHQDIEQTQISEQIVFAGSQHNVEPYFVAADLFFLPSREDPFPCVVHEAMAASLPVITFAQSGGAAEAVADTGIIIPYADINAACEAIFTLYLNAALRERLGQRACKRVHSAYNFRDYFHNIVQLIQEEMQVDLGIPSQQTTVTSSNGIEYPSMAERSSNHLCFNHLEQIKHEKNSAARPIFIVGATRSGTSIMRLALAGVYGECGANEGHLWPLYTELKETINNFFFRCQDQIAHPSTLSYTGEESLRQALCNIFHTIHMQGSGGGILIDKSPDVEMIAALPEIQKEYREVRVIFMMRHGVSNVESKLRKFPQGSFAVKCEKWVQAMETWLTVRNQLRNYIEIDQTLLRNNPLHIAEKVGGFLQMTSHQIAQLHHTFSTTTIEKTSSAESHHLLQETLWSTEEKETFKDICGTTMAKYNYSY